MIPVNRKSKFLILILISWCAANKSTSLSHPTSTTLPHTSESPISAMSSKNSEYSSAPSTNFSQTSHSIPIIDSTTTIPSKTTVTRRTGVQQSPSGDFYADPKLRCPKNSIDEYAIEGPEFVKNIGKYICQTAKDCLKVGYAKNSSRHLDISCIAQQDLEYSGCCYREAANLCGQGVAVLPIENCETLSDCNMRPNQTTQRWCDPKSRTCCRFHHEHELLCPDENTALMNELLCDNFRQDEVYSGTCPMENGICKHGHCCPPKNLTKVLPGTPYHTNHKCTIDTVIPDNVMFGFCDPRTERIHIMSTNNMHKQRNKEMTSFCGTARDCGKSFELNNVCVRIGRNISQCYINPEIEYHIPKEASMHWLTVLSYSSLGTSFLAVVFSILYKIFETKEDGETSEVSESLISRSSI